MDFHETEKQLIVEDLKKQVGSSPFVILTEYKGMTVQQFGELRKRLRAAKAEYHVAKNTMLRHAMKAAELPELDRDFGGMIAVVVGNDNSDIGAVAKVLKQFGKEFEKPKFEVGSLGKQALSAEEISASFLLMCFTDMMLEPPNLFSIHSIRTLEILETITLQSNAL